MDSDLRLMNKKELVTWSLPDLINLMPSAAACGVTLPRYG